VAEALAPLINDQRAALLGLLNDLGDAWNTITICDPWTVKDVVAHLVEGELQYGRVYRGETDEIAIDNEEAVGRWGRVDGETVRYSLWHHGSATQRVIDTRPDESWNRRVMNNGVTVELRALVPIHLFELAVHSHDVSSALGVPSTWGARTAPLVEYFINEAPVALALTPASGVVAIDTGETGRRTLDGRSGEWLFGDPGLEPSVAWTTDPETLFLVTTGRLPVADALSRTSVDGERPLLETVLADWQLAR
jgi:uncharacterized protein (TIGR03083 family)